MQLTKAYGFLIKCVSQKRRQQTPHFLHQRLTWLTTYTDSRVIFIKAIKHILSNHGGRGKREGGRKHDIILNIVSAHRALYPKRATEKDLS